MFDQFAILTVRLKNINWRKSKLFSTLLGLISVQNSSTILFIEEDMRKKISRVSECVELDRSNNSGAVNDTFSWNIRWKNIEFLFHFLRTWHHQLQLHTNMWKKIGASNVLCVKMKCALTRDIDYQWTHSISSDMCQWQSQTLISLLSSRWRVCASATLNPPPPPLSMLFSSHDSKLSSHHTNIVSIRENMQKK